MNRRERLCLRSKMVSLIILFAIGLSLLVPPSNSFASEQHVQVTLPTFQVTLNGYVVQNQYRQYPLLVYKDILYFPMTWYDCRFLGIETSWSDEDSLIIAQSPVTSSYHPYLTNDENANRFTASVAEGKVSVNGKVIENSQESYPLLIYKDVSYFPLTWRFAHDEFGWSYDWDNSQGLAIHSNNLQVHDVDLPPYAGENGTVLFKNYYYYVETVEQTNYVYRAPLNDTSRQELIYQYDINTSRGLQKGLIFSIRDNELWFTYHSGGAVMGSDVYILVSDDGTAAEIHRGYLDFKSTPTGTLIISHSVPPRGNNLSLISSDQEGSVRKGVGDPNLIYGWHVNDTLSSYGTDKSTVVIGNEAFVLASPYPLQKGDFNSIYRIDLNTNETFKIGSSQVKNFQISDNKIYYVKDADHRLYSSDLDGSKEQQLSDIEQVAWFGQLGGNLYYTVQKESGLYALYKADPSAEDPLLSTDSYVNVQIANNKIIGKLSAGESYGLCIFDESGNIEWTIADQISDVFAYSDWLLIVSAEDHAIKVLK